MAPLCTLQTLTGDHGRDCELKNYYCTLAFMICSYILHCQSACHNQLMTMYYVTDIIGLWSTLIRKNFLE